jgi:hypothetical protein
MEPHCDVHRFGSDNFGRHRWLPHATETNAKFPNPASAIRAMKTAVTVRWTPGMKKLKAIFIRQPWAWLIVNDYKDVENRIFRESKPDWITHSLEILTVGVE